MRALLIGVLVLTVSTAARSSQSLLLPEARRIQGVVVDAAGRPVPDASIDHTGQSSHSYVTDAEGRFDVTTRAPLIAVRKSGFRTEVIRTTDTAHATTTLHPSERSRGFAACRNARDHVSLEGFGAAFWLPHITGVNVGPQTNDSDYGNRGFSVKTKQGWRGIRHGAGPLWSWGLPLDSYVWQSSIYMEQTYDDSRYGRIIDARGQSASGVWWRTIVRFGESASYSDVDEQTAKLLDQVLDGACVARPVSR